MKKKHFVIVFALLLFLTSCFVVPVGPGGGGRGHGRGHGHGHGRGHR